MTNLSKDLLLEWFDDFWGWAKVGYTKAGMINPFPEHSEEAYKQIVALIKKPEVTEEWIEEKAKELHDKAYDAYPSIRSAVYWKGFIRSLIEEIK